MKIKMYLKHILKECSVVVSQVWSNNNNNNNNDNNNNNKSAGSPLQKVGALQ